MSLLLYSQLFGWALRHQGGLQCKLWVECSFHSWMVTQHAECALDLNGPTSNCAWYERLWECCQQSSLWSKNLVDCCVLFTDILRCVIWWCYAVNKQQIDNGASHWDTGLDVWTLNGNILNSGSCWLQILLHPPSVHCLPVKDTF